MNEIRKNYCDEDFPLEVEFPFHEGSDEVDFEYLYINDFDEFEVINKLSAEFYSMSGYMYLPDMDFYGSTHPQEVACFIKACLSYYTLKIKNKV